MLLSLTYITTKCRENKYYTLATKKICKKFSANCQNLMSQTSLLLLLLLTNFDFFLRNCVIFANIFDKILQKLQKISQKYKTYNLSPSTKHHYFFSKSANRKPLMFWTTPLNTKPQFIQRWYAPSDNC